MARIELHNIETTCIIGILARERQHHQRLRASISVSLDVSKAAHSCSIADTLDYALLATAVRFILDKGRFNLLETAGDALARFIIANYRQLMVEEVQVILDKPEILGDGTFPRLTINYRARDFFLLSQPYDYGWREIIQDNRDCLIDLHYLKAQQQLTFAPSTATLALSDQLEQQSSGYRNSTATTQKILAIECKNLS